MKKKMKNSFVFDISFSHDSLRRHPKWRTFELTTEDAFIGEANLLIRKGTYSF